MRPIGSKIGSNKTAAGTRRAWEPPAMTKLAIGTETRSARANKLGAESEAASSAQSHPEPPPAPAAKLGLSLEWAFPLSARFE